MRLRGQSRARSFCPVADEGAGRADLPPRRCGRLPGGARAPAATSAPPRPAQPEGAADAARPQVRGAARPGAQTARTDAHAHPSSLRSASRTSGSGRPARRDDARLPRPSLPAALPGGGAQARDLSSRGSRLGAWVRRRRAAGRGGEPAAWRSEAEARSRRPPRRLSRSRRSLGGRGGPACSRRSP